jgi:hypothetical protein
MDSQIEPSPGHQANTSKKDEFTLQTSNYDEPTAVDTEVGESYEVFQANVNGVEFRTVSWQRATILFVKFNFAMSILSIPGALAALGSVGGSLSIIGFTSLNTCEYQVPSTEVYERYNLTRRCLDTGVILGDFRHRHPECHSESASCEFGNGQS